MYTQTQRCDTRQVREELHTATSVAARLCAHFDTELVLQLVVLFVVLFSIDLDRLLICSEQV
jgi:hypothetical protein